MDGVVPCHRGQKNTDLNNLGPVCLRIFDCIPGSRCNSFQPSFVLVQCPPSLASMRVFERRPNLWLPGGVTMGHGLEDGTTICFETMKSVFQVPHSYSKMLLYHLAQHLFMQWIDSLPVKQQHRILGPDVLTSPVLQLFSDQQQTAAVFLSHVWSRGRRWV